MKIQNTKIYIFVIILLALVYFNLPSIETPTQSIVNIGQCFANEDCKKPIRYHYCDVYYECLEGKCIVQDIPCKEVCNDGIDNNFNGKYDCADTSCYTSPACSCTNAEYSYCVYGKCYCEDNKKPKWTVYSGGNACVCIN